MKRLFSPNEYRILRLLIIITIISRLALAFRPQWQLYTRPYTDDSFYIFSVSYHLAHGDGLTIDGIHPTNGIQPLIAAIYVPLFWIAGDDKVLGVRLTLITSAIFDSISILLIAGVLKRFTKRSIIVHPNLWLSPPIIAATLWTGLYPIIVHTTNGLETGLYSMMLLLTMYRYMLLRSQEATSTLHWVGFGALLGMTILTRIDAVALVGVIAIVEVIRNKNTGIRNAIVIGICALIVSSGWWINNYMLFGSIMPQSGVAESIHIDIADNIEHSWLVLNYLSLLFFFFPTYGIPIWVYCISLILVVTSVVMISRQLHLAAFLRRNYDFSTLLPFVIFSGFLLIYYIFFFAAPYFLSRYFQPIRILWLIVCCAAAPALIASIRTAMNRRRTLVLRTVIGAIFCIAMYNGMRYANYFLVRTPCEMFEMGQWALQHPEDLIGMEQTGITGFMSNNIVNLDGKVDFEALQAKVHDDIGAYIIRRDLDYLADWPQLVEPMVVSAAAHGARFERIDTAGSVVIYKRIRP